MDSVLSVGTPDKLFFVIDPEHQGGLVKVSIRCAGLHVTYVDDLVYLPSFIRRLQIELDALGHEIAYPMPLLLLGPNTDDARVRLRLNSGIAQISVHLTSGEMGRIELPLKDLQGIYSEVIQALQSISAQQA